LSDETDNFKREIQISSESSFLEFHDQIQKCTGYDPNQLYSFFICGDNWSKQTEITQIEMDTSSEEDSYTMDNTYLEDLVTEERQKLYYVFDQLSERVLYIELLQIITGKELKLPVCTKSVGDPPKQFLDYNLAAMDFTTPDLDEDFYGDDSYDDEELEGFDSDPFDDSPHDERF
jgi:hypothetical protein